MEKGPIAESNPSMSICKNLCFRFIILKGRTQNYASDFKTLKIIKTLWKHKYDLIFAVTFFICIRLTSKNIMRKYCLVVCTLIIFIPGIAQKMVNDPNAVKRSVPSFHAIQISHGIDLYLTQGNEAVAVSASAEEYRNKIITKVENGVLKIYYDQNMGLHWGGNKKMKAYVSFKTLDKLSASGGSDVYAEDGINTNDLTANFSGGSDFHGKINSGNLKIAASGGSDVYVSGKAASVTIDASGGSDFHAYDLVTDNCGIEASGGSDVYITANKEMNVNTSGGSDIHYRGSGIIKNMSSSGSSSIKRG